MDNFLSGLRADARGLVTPEHLNVAPHLLGAPLAPPRRRLYAILIDVLAVGLLSNLGNLWLLAGVALLVVMHLRGPARPLRPRLRRIGWALGAVLVMVGAQQAWVALGERPLASRMHFNRTPADEDTQDLAEAASDVASAPGLKAEHRAAARIALLEAELAQARRPKAFDPKAQLQDWAHEAGLRLGWTIAYFSLLPAWWNGQTLGKRLLGLRVVELTGKPVTMMLAFKRYGGYAAGMATGFFGFLQVLWDPNRQAIQDKTAHTVVIDVRRGLTGPAPGLSAAVPDPESR